MWRRGAARGRGPPAARRLPRRRLRGRRGVGRAAAGVRGRLPGRARRRRRRSGRSARGRLRRPLAAERGLASPAGLDRCAPLLEMLERAGTAALRPSRAGPLDATRPRRSAPARVVDVARAVSGLVAAGLRDLARAGRHGLPGAAGRVRDHGRRGAVPRGPLAHVHRPRGRDRPERLPRHGVLPAARPRARPRHLWSRAGRARHRHPCHQPRPAPAVARRARSSRHRGRLRAQPGSGAQPPRRCVHDGRAERRLELVRAAVQRRSRPRAG